MKGNWKDEDAQGGARGYSASAWKRILSLVDGLRLNGGVSKRVAQRALPASARGQPSGDKELKGSRRLLAPYSVGKRLPPVCRYRLWRVEAATRMDLWAQLSFAQPARRI